MKFSTKRDQGFGGKKLPKQLRISENNLKTLRELGELHDKSDSEIINEFLLVETNKLKILSKIIKNFEENGNCNIYNITPIFVGYYNELNQNGFTDSYQANMYIRLNFTKSFNTDFKYSVFLEKRIDYFLAGQPQPTRSNYFVGNKEAKNDRELIALLESFDWILEEDYLRIETVKKEVFQTK